MREVALFGDQPPRKFPAAPEPEKVLVARDIKVLYEPAACLPEVVVYVTAGVTAESLLDTLGSIATQEVGTMSLGVVILLDRCLGSVATPTIPHGLRNRAWVVIASCGSPSRARNALLDFVDERIPSCIWLARLDHDDVLCCPESLSAMVAAGGARSASVVLGGNRVVDRIGAWLRDNPAGDCLLDCATVIGILEAMANGSAENELPSCNLVHRRSAGLRYPDIASGEDHWLVSEWLIFRPQEVAIVAAPFYCIYSLNGAATVDARTGRQYLKARQALHAASRVWSSVLATDEAVLGLGQEGIVSASGDLVRKRFYPGIITSNTMARLSLAMRRNTGAIPSGTFSEGDCGAQWTLTYPREESYPWHQVSEAAASAFLTECLATGIVCGNVKRSNFRVRADGTLTYVDIGNWLVDMDASVFADSAIRLYSIALCGNRDEEIMRRRLPKRGRTALELLPGWPAWYRAIIDRELCAAIARLPRNIGAPLRADADVTLLIKVCAMDARDLRAQLAHILELLSYPCRYARTIVMLDSFRGPFLRAHDPGDYEKALDIVRAAVAEGEIDELLISPDDSALVAATLERWFGVRTEATRTEQGVPVFAQVWTFDQIQTRYMLQLDVDVLIGRQDLGHDFLEQMRNAISANNDTVGVAFNIPPMDSGASNPYAAPTGEYKPEVRFGLLDLERIRALLPLPNTVSNGRLVDGWYRALHAAQRSHRLRTLRGGDGRTYYLHPTNDLKHDRELIERARNCLAAGSCPPVSRGQWDLTGTRNDWALPPRTEPIVVLARGRDTPAPQLHRFLSSLLMQDEHDFGVVIIDDASKTLRTKAFRSLRIALGQRATLVRCGEHGGRMQSVVRAMRDVCVNPQSAIVFVDLDDALLVPHALRAIRSAYARGHDAVWAGAFLPDRPDHLEVPYFDNPRARWGGGVWTHLRSFRRDLFDRIPQSYLQFDSKWIERCEDVALMTCIAEIAASPCWLPEFLYLHERATVHDAQEQALRERVMMHSLTLQPLSYPPTRIQE